MVVVLVGVLPVARIVIVALFKLETVAGAVVVRVLHAALVFVGLVVLWLRYNVVERDETFMVDLELYFLC